MIRPSRSNIMMGASALLAVVIPIFVLWPDAVPEPPTPVEHVTRLVSPATLALRGTALDAPLFDAERERHDELAANAAEPNIAAAPPTPPLLVGTIAGVGSRSIALIKDATGATTTVNIGGEVDGWRLLAIGNGTAIVEQAGDRQTIALNFSNKQGGPATPQASNPTAFPAPIVAQPAVFQQPASQARPGNLNQ